MKTLSITCILILSFRPLAIAQHIHHETIVDSLVERTASAVPINTSQTQSKNGTVSNHSHMQARSHSNHFMAMAGIGTSSERGSITSVGIGYEYRLQILEQCVGIGAMGMVMFTRSGSHLMVCATGTAHFANDLFIQLEVGSAHAQNETVGQQEEPHRMALLGGLGFGWHVQVAGISLAPLVGIEYTRVQKPTYLMTLCIGI